jgi:hypothetical protein
VAPSLVRRRSAGDRLDGTGLGVRLLELAATGCLVAVAAARTLFRGEVRP